MIGLDRACLLRPFQPHSNNLDLFSWVNVHFGGKRGALALAGEPCRRFQSSRMLEVKLKTCVLYREESAPTVSVKIFQASDFSCFFVEIKTPEKGGTRGLQCRSLHLYQSAQFVINQLSVFETLRPPLKVCLLEPNLSQSKLPPLEVVGGCHCICRSNS